MLLFPLEIIFLYKLNSQGFREKIAKMDNGVWHDTVLMERRSLVVGDL